MCEHEVNEISFNTAIAGYHAVYGGLNGEEPKLRNVVGWLTITCTSCRTSRITGAVVDEYSAVIVPADTLKDFVSFVGPNPQPDQKAGACRLAVGAVIHRNAELAKKVRDAR